VRDYELRYSAFKVLLFLHSLLVFSHTIPREWPRTGFRRIHASDIAVTSTCPISTPPPSIEKHRFGAAPSSSSAASRVLLVTSQSASGTNIGSAAELSLLALSLRGSKGPTGPTASHRLKAGSDANDMLNFSNKYAMERKTRGRNDAKSLLQDRRDMRVRSVPLRGLGERG
jgi:hypothetical protein